MRLAAEVENVVGKVIDMLVKLVEDKDDFDIVVEYVTMVLILVIY